MESRLWKYKKKRRENNIKKYWLFFIFMIILSFITLNGILPHTYAWLTVNSASKGTIQNATSNDLLYINVRNIQYEANCKIKSTLSIKNKSELEIPIEVSINQNNKEIKLAQKVLKAKSTITIDSGELDLLEDKCKNHDLKYHIIGFNSYIDEFFPLQIDDSKLSGTLVNKAPNQGETTTGAGSKNISAAANGQIGVIPPNESTSSAQNTPEQKNDIQDGQNNASSPATPNNTQTMNNSGQAAKFATGNGSTAQEQVQAAP